MSWAIEEHIEDAIADYLRAKVDADKITVYTAWTDTEITMPCAVVRCGETGNVGATLFNGAREASVQVAVLTEAVPTATLTARERNREARDDMLDALAQTSLQDDLNGMNPKGVVFSMATVGDISRSVDEARRAFVSEITIECIAAPKEVK